MTQELTGQPLDSQSARNALKELLTLQKDNLLVTFVLPALLQRQKE